MRKFTMVVPTYWGRAGKDFRRDEKVVFDHPTPLDEEGTLGRLLESLAILPRFHGRLAIITVSNDDAVAGDVYERVEQILAPYRNNYDVVHWGINQFQALAGRLKAQGVAAEALALINLDNYAAVRNMCSLAGIVEGSDYTIFIDDDEVFTDPAFLDKVAEGMGREIDGEKIEALAGYYLQPTTYRLDESHVPAWRTEYWNNTVVMNLAFERYIGAEPRYKPTPFVFGGNMTVSRAALKAVPFDPKITRGEDIDFLINLRIHGITFYLDRELAITHLPPASEQRAWKKLREDAVRFLYERRKVRDHADRIPLSRLQPYPGLFLDDDLGWRIRKTGELLRAECSKENDAEGTSKCDEIIAMGQNDPFANVDTKIWLKDLTRRWRQLTTLAEGIGFA